MNSFADLVANPEGRWPAEVQSEAEREFSHRVKQSHFGLRQRGVEAPAGLYVVIGVATYSQPEMDLLDELEASHATWRRHGVKVDVFNVLNCKSHQDFQDYLPGFTGHVLQTPIVGIYQDGSLWQVVTNLRAGRKALARVSALNE
jgi:hypothetical protein